MLWGILLLLGCLALLCGPVAGWLQARELVLRPGEQVDALYLVCGSQHRRLYAMLESVAAMVPESEVPPPLLVGNDAEISFWSRRDQRNLTRAEWTVKHLHEALDNGSWPNPTISLVPGAFTGTDGEMEALAEYLAGQEEWTSVALVTCPFHARRTCLRLRKYADPDLAIRLVPVESARVDRNPWVVLGELLKMLRDAAGLSRTRGLSRRNVTGG